MEKIHIPAKLDLFQDHWNPRVLAELNGQHVKLAKLKGEFIWHRHDHEDELFYVLKGHLTMEFRDQTIELFEQDMLIVPRGVEHRPVAREEVSVLLFEPVSTLNTGDQTNEMTRSNFQNI